jgi:hypothetical protein
MYYSYIEIEYVVTSFSPARMDLALKLLILIYCVSKGKNISPKTNNTNTVEWFFGDAWQRVGGSMNKLTVAGFDRANKKASTFNAAKFSLVGNNTTGDNMFGRNKNSR